LPLSQLQYANNQTHFDRTTGTLFLFGNESANTFQQAIAPNGYLELAIDNNKYSSDTQSPFFAPFLIGATNHSIQTITLDGGDGEDKLILGGQLDSPNLSITTDDSIDITGSLTATNNLSILSDKLTLNQAILTATDSNNGGTIHLLGKDISVINSAISASGDRSGGTILIGGDYQGKGTVPNAKHTYIGSNVQINAEATQTGNGGKVIVWADDTTEYYGNITARGGATSGDGGSAEVSGKQNLKYRGHADLGSTNGKLGTLLLDPTDIYISNAAEDDQTTIDANEFSQQIGDISLEAERSIYVRSNLNFVPSPGNSISFTVANGANNNNGFFTSESNVDIYAPGRNITISGGAIGLNGTLSTASNIGNGGSITLTTLNASPYSNYLGTGSLQTFSTIGEGGNISLSSSSTIDIQGIMDVSGKTSSGQVDIIANESIGVYDIYSGRIFGLISSVTENGNGKPINLTSTTGSIIVGEIRSEASGNSGDINLSAQQDISSYIFFSGSNNGNSGDIQLTSTGGAIYNSSMRSQASGNGGSILLEASGDITTGGITSYAYGGGNSGNVTLTSDQGDITTRSIATNSTGAGNGGDVKLYSDLGNITADYIRSDSAGGSGGNIKVDSDGDITAEWLRADSNLGAGGKIELIADKFIKVKGSTQINGNNFSIFTDSVGDSSAPIFIKHSTQVVNNPAPFIVGDTSVNGTANGISDGVAIMGVSATHTIYLGYGIYSNNDIYITSPILVAGSPTPPVSKPSPQDLWSSFVSLYETQFTQCLQQKFAIDIDKLNGFLPIKNLIFDVDVSLNYQGVGDIGQGGERAGEAAGSNDPSKYIIYIAREIYESNSPRTLDAIYATIAHEAANILDYQLSQITGRAKDESNYGNSCLAGDPEIKDGDSGAAVEFCMFEKFVYPDYVVTPKNCTP
jgi:hypothetical protein